MGTTRQRLRPSDRLAEARRSAGAATAARSRAHSTRPLITPTGNVTENAPRCDGSCTALRWPMQHAALTHAPHCTLHPTLKALLPHPVSSPHEPPQAYARTAPGHPIHPSEASGSPFQTTQGESLGNAAKPDSRHPFPHSYLNRTTKPRAIPWAILYSDKRLPSGACAPVWENSRESVTSSRPVRR